MTEIERLRAKIELLAETAPDKWIETVVESIGEVLDVVEQKQAIGFKNEEEK